MAIVSIRMLTVTFRQVEGNGSTDYTLNTLVIFGLGLKEAKTMSEKVDLAVILGNALRVPSHSYNGWGFKKEDDKIGNPLRISDKYYKEEWEFLTEEEHKDIAEAARRAGIGDANRLLNIETGRVVNKLVNRLTGKIHILDVGAGAGDTSIQILETLKVDDRARVIFALLDPVDNFLEVARNRLKAADLVEDVSYMTLVGRDLNIPEKVGQGAQHIAVAVASVHHHAFLDEPFRCIYYTLKRGGFFITADWHHTMWEHPNRVYKLLQRMPDWPTKAKDLEEFKRSYEAAIQEIPDPDDSRDRKANEQISNFWIEYSKMEHRSKRFQMLEGHRPAEQYLEEMRKVGFLTDSEVIRQILPSNPHQILLDSSLLCICLAQKI